MRLLDAFGKIDQAAEKSACKRELGWVFYRNKAYGRGVKIRKGGSVNLGWITDPTEGDIEREYFPSLWGKEDNNVPKSTYSLANIFAFSLELTLELRGTGILVNVVCGRESDEAKGEIASPVSVPDELSWIISTTSALTASSIAPEESWEDTGKMGWGARLLSRRTAIFSGEKAVLMAWDTTADTVAEMAETSNETVPRVEEVSPKRTWTLSETEFNVEARGLLACVEVAEAMEVLGAARF